MQTHEYIGNQSFIIVSFYTPEYSRVFQFLITSLKWLGLSYYIEEYPKLGNWQSITWIKPEFIKRMMGKFPDKNIVWVDSDAAFIRYPKELENIAEDFAICFHENSDSPHKNIPPGLTKDRRLYHSGCFLVKPSALPLIEQWILLKNKYIEVVPDQYVINFASEKCPNISIANLGLDYINTLHENKERCYKIIVTPDPAIIHFIFSNTTDEESNIFGNQPQYLYDLYSDNGKQNALRLIQYQAKIKQSYKSSSKPKEQPTRRAPAIHARRKLRIK